MCRLGGDRLLFISRYDVYIRNKKVCQSVTCEFGYVRELIYLGKQKLNGEHYRLNAFIILDIVRLSYIKTHFDDVDDNVSKVSTKIDQRY